MKRCSQCNTTYSDADTDLQFCLLDGTPLVFVPDSSFEKTVNLSIPTIQQTLPAVRQGVNPSFVYLAIGLLILFSIGAVFFWLNSDSNASPVSKTENEITTKSPTTNGLDEIDRQKQNLESERAEIEKEKQKLQNEREKLDSKKNAPPTVSTNPASKPSAGTWFVILGSFERNEQWKADERLQYVRNAGYEASIINTDNYPGFRSGFWSVVMGPYSKSEARSLLSRMKSVRSDAYIKSGW